MLLPAISQFVSGTVTDTLKNVLRPAPLFSAAVFILLNLLFVLNPLLGVESELGTFVSNVLSLDIVWLAALATVLTIILAYVLNSLNGTIYSFMTGESWENAYWIGAIAKRLQKIHWKSMNDAIQQMRDSPAKNILKYQFRTQFPAIPEYIAPTALGNVLTAQASIVWDRYKMDLTALWPHMQIAIADQAELKASIDNEKNGLDFLITFSFTILLFVVECLLLNLFRVSLPFLGWHYLLLLLLAYGIYRAGVVKAVNWGQTMMVAFDLHQETLRQKLGLRSFENRTTARERWGLLSRHILYGKVSAKELDPFFDEAKKAETSSATVTASPNVSIVFQQDLVKLKEPLTREFDYAQGNAVHHYVSEIRYSILLSNMPTGKTKLDFWPAARGVFIIVDEPRVPWVDVPPSGGSNWLGYRTAPKRLFWQLRRSLGVNETIKLEYSLPLALWTVTTNHTDLKIMTASSSISKEAEDYVIKLDLTNTGSVPLTGCKVEIFDSRAADPAEYETPAGAEVLENPSGYRFTIRGISAGQTLPLLKRIKLKSS